MQNKKFITIGVIAVLILIIGVWVAESYNTLVKQDEQVNNKWAQVDTQLERRYDLIPNLVSTVKGIAKQEQEVFGKLADARMRYAGATTPEARAQAANETESALGRLLVIVENYPNLQSSQAFRDLMVSLEGSENRIAVARKDYNDAVTAFNTKVKTFPASTVASMFNFDARTYFEVREEAKQVPVVNF